VRTIVAAVASVLLTLGLLFDRMGYQAAGLGMALGNLANGGLLLFMYRGPESLLKKVDLGFVASILIATAGMSAVVLLSISAFGPDAHGLAAKAWKALVPVSLGAGVYLGLALLLRVPEATRVVGMVRQRFAR